jgi:cytochrome P450
MFAAGTDTTYTTLVWAMAELINHPHEMRKVQDEIRAAVAIAGGDDVNEDHLEKLRYLKCVVKETLRLHTHRCHSCCPMRRQRTRSYSTIMS